MLALPNSPTKNDHIAIDRAIAKHGLSAYLRRAWPVADSETYLHNWHMDAIAEHLEACITGDIKRLLINVPPGTSKSTATCVYFPSYLWGPAEWPSAKFISASFSLDNAKRDNRKTRDLIQTGWYQNRWPTRLRKVEEQYLENTDKGFRQCSSVTGITGKRGHFVVWDDPLNPEMANSDTERETANRIFAETLPNRLISPENSVIIIIMQRLHQYDVSGYILENDLGYQHLCLPMEFEVERRCRTSIGFEDPRTVDGELLHPSRFTPEVVERDKKVMGEYAWAGQAQQRPAPREGGMFKRAKFEIVEAAPVGIRWVRGWDLAGSKEKTAAFTAGVKMGIAPDGTIYIADVVRIQGEPGDVETLVRNTAALDGRQVRGSIPQDPGSAGKATAINFVTKVVPGYPYFYSPESGDKVSRAEPLAAQVSAGNVRLIKGNWNKDFLDEAEVFPSGRFLDQIDASSRAYIELTQNMPGTPLKGSYG